MTRGRYVVRAEFMGFAAFTQEVVLNPENPSAEVEAELILASRQQEQAMREFRDRAHGDGGGVFGGGGGGGRGGPAGGMIVLGRMPKGFNINQPHGVLYFSDDNAGLDARSYSLTGIESPKADYNQARFGVNIGGPFNIPKMFYERNTGFFFGRRR